MLACTATAAAPLVCHHHRHQFGATASHAEKQLRNYHGRATTISNNNNNTNTRRRRRHSRAASLVTPKAVSIYDAVRGDDESSSSGDFDEPPPQASPTVASYAAKKPPAVGPAVVAPAVISSKAYMLSTAEDLGAGVSCDGDEEEGCAMTENEDGIFQWTLKYVDKNLDEIEKEKPKQAEVAWKAGGVGV